MAEPYYQDEFVTLFHGDCLVITDWLDADVLVTDPPYGTQALANNPKGGYGRRYLYDKGDGVGAQIANDMTTETRDAALKLWLGGGDKPMLIFASPRMPEPPFTWADRLVWDKKRLGMNGGPWRYRHESIFVSEGFRRVSDGSSSILTAFPEQDDHIHGKPLALMETLIESAPEGVIADPFAGSCSTLVAARNLGRKAIGVELEEKYCEILARRLSQQAFNFEEFADA